MNNLITHPAVLLMESHGLAPNVRSSSFASMKVWSKLYQAGPYYLDVVLGPGERGLSLRGEILAADDSAVPAEGRVTLHDGGGAILSSGSLNSRAGSEGAFTFDVERSGNYRVEVVLRNELLSVAGLNVG